MTDKRIAWLRENVPAFKDANDKAEAALRDTKENRERFKTDKDNEGVTRG